MCTAISHFNHCHYFGRNLDLEYSYNEAVTITPRCYPFIFRNAADTKKHYAMIGMATVLDGYPLYYDATNEHGLSIAGLNFPGNAVYLPAKSDYSNIAPFELIPWILCQCANVDEAEDLLMKTNLQNISFSTSLPNTPLHWLLADRSRSIAVEPMTDGIKIFTNPVGVLTNNPPFAFHMHNLCNYLNLSPKEPNKLFCGKVELTPYSRAMGAIGLPGDASSASRFVKAVFHKLNSVADDTEDGNVGQFFHILDSVSMINGSVSLGTKLDKTVYSSCCNTDKRVYYYTTYENRQITAVKMDCCNLDGDRLTCYPLRKEQQIIYEK